MTLRVGWNVFVLYYSSRFKTGILNLTIKKAFGVDSSHAAGSSGRYCLTIDRVLHVTTGKDARYVRLHAVSGRFQVSGIAHLSDDYLTPSSAHLIEHEHFRFSLKPYAQTAAFSVTALTLKRFRSRPRR